MGTELRERCHTELHGHGGRDPDADVYGRGPRLQGLEKRVADLLGKPAAVMMPSGTMAQQIALRIAADASGRRHIGLHATSHLDRDEHRGYSSLHGLHATLLGQPSKVFGAADVERCAQPLSTVVIELPARRLGGALTPWEDVLAIREVTSSRGTKLHLDGARLWEAAAGYGKPLAEVASPFDSVYVSLYKGIGAPAGAVLLGSPELIAEARIWQRRHGGNLPSLDAFVVPALANLEDRIARMPQYLERCRAIVERAVGPGVRAVPAVPETNLVHLHIDAGIEAAVEARASVAEAHGIWLFSGLWGTAVGCATELYIGDAGLEAELGAVGPAWESFRSHLIRPARGVRIERHPAPLAEPLSERVRAVHDEVFVQDFDGLSRAVLKALGSWWVAFEGDQVVGFKCGKPTDSGAFFSMMGGVSGTHRRQGIARRLMAAQHDWLRAEGFHSVHTHTLNRFRAMLLLNIQMGFEVVGMGKTGDGVPKILLEKCLDH